MTAYKLTAEQRATQQRNAALARAPFGTTHRTPGKSWAGALISNLDDAFGLGRLSRGRDAGAFAGDDDQGYYLMKAWEAE